MRPTPVTLGLALGDGSDRDAAARTIDSIKRAGTAVAQLVVIGPDDIGSVEVHEQWNAALAAATQPWFAPLPAGAEIVVDGFEQLGRALRAAEGAAVVYTDECAVVVGADEPTEILKPGWSPRLALEGNYVGALCAVRVDAARNAGGYEAGDAVTVGYDLLLRLADAGAEITSAPLLTVDTGGQWPASATPAARAAAVRVVERSLARRGLVGGVEPGDVWHRVRLVADEAPVTVVIPTRDRLKLLERCVSSIETHTRYPSFEIVIVDNGSVKEDTLEYLAASPHRVIRHPGAFNFSDLVNDGVAASTTPLAVLLNNDTIVEDGGWLSAMVAEFADPAVAAVGSRLLFKDGTPQHEGIALGVGGLPAVNLDLGEYCHFNTAVRDVVAVTAACVAVRRSAWDAVGGFDSTLAVGWGDVDFCLRLRAAGHRIVYTPHATLVHIGQASRHDNPHRYDDQLFAARWPLHRSRDVDPFVNRRIEGFSPLWISPAERRDRNASPTR